MDEHLAIAARRIFKYPSLPKTRRHGPRGYANYQSYKPWLRDEFQFRCIYCLCREQWEPNGHHVFAVEHMLPRSSDPNLEGEYDNLLYSCLTCNALRQDQTLPFHLIAEPVSEHLQVEQDGSVRALSPEGRELLDIVQLNRPSLLRYRHRILSMVELLLRRTDRKHQKVLTDILAYPADLPNLAVLRPPHGNLRPEGIGQSFFDRRKHNNLPIVN